MSNYSAEDKTFYLSCWRDTLNQLNDSTDTEVINACKAHLTMMKNQTWFTDGITSSDLAEINTALS